MNPYREERTPAAAEYQDQSTLPQQYETCLDFMEEKGLYDEFYFWLEDSQIETPALYNPRLTLRQGTEWLTEVRAYCHARPDFWAWLG